MFRLTFNPGPSQVSDAVKADMAYAAKHNIVGISHRSQECLDITRQAVEGLRTYFKVPADYHVIFTSSATEALELVVRNLVEKESFHFTNGHFSELFAKVSRSFGRTANTDAVEWGEQNDFAGATIPDTAEIVTLTYNETSTGVSCTPQDLKTLRGRLKGRLLVADITSAAGCVELDISQADVWLFSVQKGMGLPSGLGVLFISPAALNRAKELHPAGLFNFASMTEKMSEHQTLQTPNVLGIFLLARQLERWNKLPGDANYKATDAKAALIEKFIESHPKLSYFVSDPSARSKTAVCVAAEPATIVAMHQAAKAADIVLGAGYGKIKDTTCRVATFPALSQADVQELLDVLAPAVS
jgi:phosphoserine aminotransferase